MNADCSDARQKKRVERVRKEAEARSGRDEEQKTKDGPSERKKREQVHSLPNGPITLPGRIIWTGEATNPRHPNHLTEGVDIVTHVTRLLIRPLARTVPPYLVLTKRGLSRRRPLPDGKGSGRLAARL